ncbi:hypothetical protein QR680_002796 [Steinernema hermaphroditum]|uniref:Uncharacterized protein n=1 Tax=Steinernema hermaphroditum TaxID=289476 RepID=A0AA39LIT7_9BILA|nr:hypothetical protein QR680_002796 [Steinernema hermaphroditum]
MSNCAAPGCAPLLFVLTSVSYLRYASLKRTLVPQQVEETAAPFSKESSAITRKEHEFLLKVAAEVVAAARSIPAENAIAGTSDIHIRLPKGYRVHLPESAPQSLNGVSVERRVPSSRIRLRVSFAQLSLGLEAGSAARRELFKLCAKFDPRVVNARTSPP